MLDREDVGQLIPVARLAAAQAALREAAAERSGEKALVDATL